MPNTNTNLNNANIDDFMMYELLEKQAHLQALYDMGAITKHEKEVLSKEMQMHDEHEHKHENDEHNLVPCDRCGELHDPDDLVTVHTENGDEKWCIECADLHATICDHCGQLVSHDATSTVETSCYAQEWCPECVEEDATTCGRCGQLVECDETREVCTRHGHWSNAYRDARGMWHSGRWVEPEYQDWCEGCCDYHAVQCEDCDERFDENIIESLEMYDGGEHYVCPSCRNENYYICNDCGSWVHCDDAFFDDDDDFAYCPDCWLERRRGAIQSYRHTGAECFWLDAGNKKYWRQLTSAEERIRFMGVELEVDDLHDRNCCARDISNEYDCELIQLKEDGSLTSRGFEIVSQPMTIEAHLNMGIWEFITESVKSYGGTSHEAGTCGLHIHVSRDSLRSRDTVYRLDRLFHRFAPQMQRFARRTDGQMHWCRIGRDDLKDIPDVHDRKEKWMKEKNWDGRYQAVNDTNANTVEIRMWRGTLNMETIRATIEFTWGLVDICDKMSDEFADQLTGSMVKVLVRFALEEAGLPHDDFDNYITRRGL